jgi:acetoin utilization deacetylase AcuC-like enzyme
MTTLLVTHPVFAEHLTDPGHPECPARIEAVWAALATAGFDALIRMEAPLADRDDLTRVHPPAYVDALLARIPERGLWNLDADTIVSPRSGQAALHAAGAVVAAVDAVMAGTASNALCAVRPPGHHATAMQSGGFCIFNNIAIGGLAAQARHGLERIAVVDFDVHHGNGTQDILGDRDGFFFASTHQSPLYPFTGAAHETGRYSGVVNVPLSAGMGGPAFRVIFEDRILARLEAFAPQLILVSAGFDAHRADPLGGLGLDEQDFHWLARTIRGVAETCCNGRLVAVLEGGYDLPALRQSVAAFVKGLMT